MRSSLFVLGLVLLIAIAACFAQGCSSSDDDDDDDAAVDDDVDDDSDDDAGDDTSTDDDADDDADDDSTDDDADDDTTALCDLGSTPDIGVFTPTFTEETDCTCDAGNTDCHALYVGRVDVFDGNTATLSFQKASGSAPSVDLTYWIVVSDEEPNCTLLDVYVVRSTGAWDSSQTTLTVDVPIWPDQESCETASVGEVKHLFIITDGSDASGVKTWFQKEWLTFTKE